MKTIKQSLSKRDLQSKIANDTKRNTALTNDWLRDNGIDEKQLTAGMPEILQAQRLATSVLSNYSTFLGQNEGHTLNNFIIKANNPKSRKKMTLGQCFTVMNIAKDAQRKFAKKLREQHQQHIMAH
jgi:hypothetical protein